MSCVSNNTMGPRRSRSAFSLLELLVAMMVTMIFVGAVYTTFLQISRGHQAAEARMDALRNGRAALGKLSAELKDANTRGNNSQYYFVGGGKNLKLENGDGRDNDGDGLIDEEVVNGILDAPTSGTVADLDRHALLGGTLKERPEGVALSDLGDAQVDVDAVFGRDVLTYQIYPNGVGAPDVDYKLISYEVKDFEGQPNVLVRRAEIHYNSKPTAVAESPLAFNVAGFDLLYWNPDDSLAQFTKGWHTDWDSEVLKNIPGVNFHLPASVYIRLTLLADPRPAATVQALRTANPDAPIDVITLETVVNIEETLKDGNYPRA